MSTDFSARRGAARRHVERLIWRLLPLLPLAAMLLGWTIYWNVAHPVAATLPPLSGVISAFVELVASGRLIDDIAASLLRLVLGASIGIVTGVLAGFLIGLNRNAAAFFSPLIVFFNAISGIVWLPLMIGWLGIGTALAVFLIWNSVFFIVFQNTVLGVQLVPEFYEQGVRALGAGRFETLRSVTLPGALPHILAGIRSGLGFGWRALIAAELVGATTGLGQLIFAAAEYSRSDIIIVGCLIIGCIAMAMDRWLLLPIERRTVQRWGLVASSKDGA
jgi:NitT/TauT family transport system permease protein/taurine transport system permease protein